MGFAESNSAGREIERENVWVKSVYKQQVSEKGVYLAFTIPFKKKQGLKMSNTHNSSIVDYTSEQTEKINLGCN